MRQAVAKAYALQHFCGLRFIRDTVEILREHHVFQRREIGHKMKLLENEAEGRLASGRIGNALKIATITVKATATGYTISRGPAATPKTALPKPMERKIPAAAPIMPPARPSNAASAKKSRSTRRIEPPIAFIKPTSIFRSIATLVIAAITHSPLSSSTIPTVAVNNPLIRL